MIHLAFFFAAVTFLLWKGFAVSCAWNLLLVPVLGWPALSWPAGVAVFFMVQFLRPLTPDDERPKTWERLGVKSIQATLNPAFGIAFAWLIHFWLVNAA